MRILVADDNAVSRELIREILEAAGHEIIEASDGTDALARIRAFLPEVVFLDIQMPLLNGYEVIREIRSDPELRSLRVIALTAYAMEKDRNRALAAGFDSYISKPVNAAAVRQEVERAAGRTRGATA